MAKPQTQETPATAPKAPEAAKAQPKAGELKTLFTQYEQANSAVAKASAAYDKTMADRSKVVEQFAAFGKAFTAPNGDRLKVIERTNKETGAKNFYFQGPGKAEALKIE
jgi:hypothetical protein